MAGQGDHCEYRARPGQADPTGAPDPGAPRATHPRAAAGPGDEAARDPRARALARREPRTVAEAYEELVAAGWARAHVGQGTFVTESPGAPGASGPRRTSGRPPSVAGA